MKRFDNINVIPFIDIMLVLLAIVLTTATFIAQGKLDIVLPEAESNTTPILADSIELAIDASGSVYYNEQAVTTEQLARRLESLDVDNAIVLRVDRQTQFDAFVTVVDLLKANQLDKVSILTRDG